MAVFYYPVSRHLPRLDLTPAVISQAASSGIFKIANMAPVSGHIVVPLAMRIVRHAFKKASSFVRSQLSAEGRVLNTQLQPVLLRNTVRHPVHPAALLRQSKGRWYTTRSAINASLRRFTASARSSAARYDRASFPRSSAGIAVNRLSGRTPFASTLRPNLTGGALPRTAGGYSTGAGRIGGARHFSHSPAASAEVVNNVSAAVRAFWLSGHKASFDGNNAVTGEKRFKAVSCLQAETTRKLQSLPRTNSGSYIDFSLSPTITAVSPLIGLSGYQTSETPALGTITTDGLLDLLSVDFARAFKDLGIVLSDLRRLSTLGDLQMHMPSQSTIRVRFPGCDAETVERLCDEIGLQRGIIRQDEDFDVSVGSDMALMFPFAPGAATSVASTGEHRHFPDQVDWQMMMTPSPRAQQIPQVVSTSTNSSVDFAVVDPTTTSDAAAASNNPWAIPLSSSGYSSLHASEADVEDQDGPAINCSDYAAVRMPATTSAEDYEGLEGIYRFLEGCDGARW